LLVAGGSRQLQLQKAKNKC